MTVTSVRRTGSSNVIFRGATAFFLTTFYDPYGNIAQPNSADVSIVYPTLTGGTANTIVTMSAPGLGETAWTAEWDTRNVGPGTVYFSIHSSGSPASVQDGQFNLTANPANLQTFS